MAELVTVARPYAEAAFKLAREQATFNGWSEALALLEAVINEPRVKALIGDPNVGASELERLILAVVGDQLPGYGRNLVQVLVDNGRLELLPQMRSLYEALRREHESVLEVQIFSPLPVTDEQLAALVARLETKHQRRVRITVEIDPGLIGGIKIVIGDNVVIDDACCLDAKGTDNHGLVIGNGVFVGRQTILSCKNGDIIIDDRANIGFNCEIFSASRVRVGKDTLMAAYTYLVGGDHLYDRTDIPVLQQGRTARGIEVGDGVWLGAHVVVTDGSTIGRDAIVGAGAVVVGEIPEFAIATGITAKVTRDRREPKTES